MNPVPSGSGEVCGSRAARAVIFGDCSTVAGKESFLDERNRSNYRTSRATRANLNERENAMSEQELRSNWLGHKVARSGEPWS